MKKITLFAGVGMAVLAFASCSKNNDFVGSWQAMQPMDITRSVPAASTASSLNSITFGAAENGMDGDVFFTSIINVTQGVSQNLGVDAGYEVDVAATATVKGKWSYAPGDDDDILVTFDPSTLNVEVDNNGVTFRQNLVTEAQQPVTDSLTAATAALWKQQLTSAMQTELARYSKLDDIKVKDGKTLKFEIENPEQDVYFRMAE